MDSLEKVLQDIREWCDGTGKTGLSYIAIDRGGSCKLFASQPEYNHLDGCWYASLEYRILSEPILCRKILSFCNNVWSRCCYMLPPSKPEYNKQVLDVFVSDPADDCVILDCRDTKEAKKIQRQLEAQYKIIDTIQKTQKTIDPDWVADWDNGNQR